MAILAWLAITRFTIMEGYYSARPLAQVILIAMLLIYLVSAGMLFLAIKPLVRIAIFLLAGSFAVYALWAALDLGLDSANALLLVLHAVNLVSAILLYRKVSKSQGPSVLDMPIFG
jgi:hypothetical protein